MTKLLQVARAGLAQEDQHIKELESKRKTRHDKDITLGQSITKVVRASFGKQLLYFSSIFVVMILHWMQLVSIICFVLQVQKTGL